MSLSIPAKYLYLFDKMRRMIIPVLLGALVTQASEAAETSFEYRVPIRKLSVVTQVSPSLGAWLLATRVYGDASFSLTPPSSNSTGEFTYSSSSPSVAVVNGNVVTIVGAGTTTLTASQSATSRYLAGSASAILTVAPAQPTLGQFTIPTQTAGGSPFTLTPPTSSSPGSFSFTSSNTAVATVSGGTVTLTGAGTTLITATQSATADFTSAVTSATLTVSAITPTLSNFPAVSRAVNGGAVTLTPPTSNSPGSFSYSSNNPSVATVTNAGVVTPVAQGTATITATQAASGNYGTAAIAMTFTVTAATLQPGFVQKAGLTWSPSPGYQMVWSNANNYCNTAKLNGQYGWRLPTGDELSSLGSYGWPPTSTYFPNGSYWSSTAYPYGGHITAGPYASTGPTPDATAEWVTCVHI